MDLEAAREAEGRRNGIYRLCTLVCFLIACLLMISSLLGSANLGWSMVDDHAAAGQHGPSIAGRG